MMIRSVFIVSLMLVLGPMLPMAAAEGAGDRIPPGELFQLIHVGAPPPIVDVRSAAEYTRGHVPGAIHIPFWRVLGNTSPIASFRNQPIVVYCELGPRAALAKAVLHLSGFKKVLYLEGHLHAWRDAGLPLVTEPPKALAPHP